MSVCVTVWAWETVLRDDCYQISVDSLLDPPERPWEQGERRVLAVRVASLVERMHGRECPHEIQPIFSRPWRNWFRKKTWFVCVACDEIWDDRVDVA